MPLHPVVLHIDDDADTRLLFREIISEQMEGLAVRWLEAAGVEEAVARHRTENVALVLLDHRLGADQGLDLIARIKNQWSCPVWMLTGICPEAIGERAKLCGAAGVLCKDELIEKRIDWRALLTAQTEARP
jgi:DNA-binding response OmpR family regulator